MTGPIDDHTCGDPAPQTGCGVTLARAAEGPCPCWLSYGHTGPHRCAHGWTWESA